MKKIKYLIRNHFGFSQKETNGFIILIILIFFLLFTPLVFDLLYTPSYAETTLEEKLLDSLIGEISTKEDLSESTFPESNLMLTPAFFDPNTEKQEVLADIVGNKIAGTIVKFRSKGGKFRVKTDLLKVYGVSKALYNQLNPFIQLPDSVGFSTKIDKKIKQVVFDINKSDTSDLKRLKGIGSVLAIRIIKFRDKLGGFISTDQYSEVYGLSDVALKELKEHTFIANDFIPKKVFVKNAEVQILAGHPYIGKRNAQLIFNYRNHHPEALQSSEDLKKIVSIEKEKIDKMSPYLSF